VAEHLLIIFVTAALMIVGLAGSVLPVIPGSPLILLGAFVYAWYTGFALVTWATLLWLAGLTLLSHFLEFLATAWGVKKYGGSRWAMLGAVAGGIFGTFAAGIAGLVLGPFVGAFLFEIIHSGSAKKSWRSAAGTLIGLLFGTLGKLVLSAVMIGIFLVKIRG